MAAECRAGGEAGGPLPSRDAGLGRLSAFLPKVADYARERNRVVPPQDRVSGLSPYLRHRLILEYEVIGAVWSAHPPAAVEKLVAEVLWRTYWKGWLELRPQVWRSYLEQWRHDRDGLDGPAAERHAAAVAGRTGIACFDAWVGELTATGYLHNHVRMWLASIWIFTLRLPWTLGAAFFLRHLLDGDPASNTLSWRWVAGLHTRGKHYLARAENIARYTEGRFDPRGQLDEQARPLIEPWLDLSPRPLLERTSPDPAATSALLLTPDDLTAERSPIAGLRFLGVAGGWDRGVLRELDLAPAVAAFTGEALGDSLSRAGAHFGVSSHRLDETAWVQSAEDWARGLGVSQLVTLETPVGPWAERIEGLGLRLAPQGIRLVRLRRPWDSTLWPGATQGFFRVQ
ncbi:MAG: FAD-binding domain-containing protein, partial [Bdellovibrio bacteriovorus]